MRLDKDQQKKVVEEFEDSNSVLKFIIVTSKIIIDLSSILQTMYLDKSQRPHSVAGYAEQIDFIQIKLWKDS